MGLWSNADTIVASDKTSLAMDNLPATTCSRLDWTTSCPQAGTSPRYDRATLSHRWTTHQLDAAASPEQFTQD